VNLPGPSAGPHRLAGDNAVNSLAQAITGDANARVLVLHIDDVGMCHGANVAFLELARAGRVTCGSAMVPCPWFREIAAAAAEDPTLDLGVHLTLTSEWPQYRWGPLSTVARASGLIDDQGYFPRNCLELRSRLEPEAAEIEFRAQIDRALAAGIDVTHLDTHMGAAVVPELVDVYVRLGREYRLPILLPRELDSYTAVLRMGEIRAGIYEPIIADLDASGLPVFDRFRMTPGVPSPEVDAKYRLMIASLPPGASFFGVHCNAPGDIEAIVPSRAHWRTDEYRLFGSGAPMRWAVEAGIRAIGMREVRDLWRGALPA
jgi:chitin disaccharide deacetylase